MLLTLMKQLLKKTTVYFTQRGSKKFDFSPNCSNFFIFGF